METVKLREDINSKLIRLGIKTTFIRNILKQVDYNKEKFNKRIMKTNEKGYWKYMILFAFNWKKTQEGYGFWVAIAYDEPFAHIPICTDYKIVFKPEFEEHLKKLGVKQKFVKNLRLFCKKYNFDLYGRWEEMNAMSLWKHFIGYGFQWAGTPEGRDYWERISNL